MSILKAIEAKDAVMLGKLFQSTPEKNRYVVFQQALAMHFMDMRVSPDWMDHASISESFILLVDDTVARLLMPVHSEFYAYFLANHYIPVSALIHWERYFPIRTSGATRHELLQLVTRLQALHDQLVLVQTTLAVTYPEIRNSVEQGSELGKRIRFLSLDKHLVQELNSIRSLLFNLKAVCS